MDPNGLVLPLSSFNPLDNSPKVLGAIWSNVKVPQLSDPYKSYSWSLTAHEEFTQGMIPAPSHKDTVE